MQNKQSERTGNVCGGACWNVCVSGVRGGELCVVLVRSVGKGGLCLEGGLDGRADLWEGPAGFLVTRRAPLGLILILCLGSRAALSSFLCFLGLGMRLALMVRNMTWFLPFFYAFLCFFFELCFFCFKLNFCVYIMF